MKFVQIAEYTAGTAAHLARVRLETAGIEAWLDNENFNSVYPFHTGIVGGVKLMVAQEDAERAVHVLAEQDDAAHPAAGREECPACHSENTGQNPASLPWTLLLTVLSFGLYLPLCYKARACRDCGHQW